MTDTVTLSCLARKGAVINPLVAGNVSSLVTVRRGLARWAAHRTVAEAEVLHPRAVRRHPAGGEDFARRLVGHRIGTPSRRGWSVQRAITDCSIGVTLSDASENISSRLEDEYGWSITGGLEMFGIAAAPI